MKNSPEAPEIKRLLLLLLLCSGPLAAQDFPSHVSTRVNDFANLIDAETEDRIDQTLATLFTETGVEFTVVTIDRRADYGDSRDIETFATGLFNAWGVGNADRNDGILLLVAGGDREMRLELGSGYPASYDWLAADVVDLAILPRFRDGDLAGGIEAGVNDAITRIATPFAESREPQAPPTPAKVATGTGSEAPLWFIGAFIAAIAALVLRRPLAGALIRFRACPSCGQRRLSRARRIVTPATPLSSGLAEITDTCAACGWHRTRQQTIPPGSDRDSPSSGGGFGGGSSSGGGATGRW